MKFFTTVQVAKAAGITRATLQAWIAAGKIKAPPVKLKDNIAIRLWTQAQVEQVTKFKAANYCKGRGRKKGKVRR
jgi:predicted site-specific integrase-resolvase